LGEIVASLETNVSPYPLCDALHRAVVRFADQVDLLDAELLCSCQDVQHQPAANSARAPLRFDRKGSLGRITPARAHGSKLGSSAHFVSIEVPEDGGIAQVDATDVVPKEAIGDFVTES
jgi:hypothetical protein